MKRPEAPAYPGWLRGWHWANAALFVDQRGEQPAERVGRIRHPAAERAGVEVALRPGQLDLHVREAPEPVTDGRNTVGEHRRVRYDDQVGFQQLFLLPQE